MYSVIWEEKGNMRMKIEELREMVREVMESEVGSLEPLSGEEASDEGGPSNKLSAGKVVDVIKQARKHAGMVQSLLAKLEIADVFPPRPLDPNEEPDEDRRLLDAYRNDVDGMIKNLGRMLARAEARVERRVRR